MSSSLLGSRIIKMVIGAVSLAAPWLGLYGCSAPDEAVGICDPNNLYYSSVLCGPDAGADSGSEDADGAIDSDAESARCPGRCAPFPEGVDAVRWSRWPGSFLTGPAWEPSWGCPAGFTKEFELFTDLDAPPATCDICECTASTGLCPNPAIPDDIHFNAGQCYSGAMTLPFDGPPDWDGSCTSANAVPAGAKCPAGSQMLCAQSISVGALPSPTMESCAVAEVPVPALTKSTAWKTRGIACRGNVDETRCGASEACVSVLPFPYLQCIWRDGEHPCPLHYDKGERFVMYPESGIVDTRDCTNCECGPPEGSGCLGTIHLYDDASCMSEFWKTPVSSFSAPCYDVTPPGRAIGAKAITDVSYVPGTCAASGGEPFGKAAPDDMQAVTFCCLLPEPIFE